MSYFLSKFGIEIARSGSADTKEVPESGQSFPAASDFVASDFGQTIRL